MRLPGTLSDPVGALVGSYPGGPAAYESGGKSFRAGRLCGSARGLTRQV